MSTPDSKISIFADDTRITRWIKNEDDLNGMQEDLEKLYTWELSNNMMFNGKKFELLRYGKNEDLKTMTNYMIPNSDGPIDEK